MADGATHDKHGLALTALALAVAGALFLGWRSMGALFLPLGTLIGTFLLSPDLDMWTASPIKRWGPLRFLWAPYAFLHKHRGYSHNPFLGPAGRLFYLAALSAPIYLYVSGLRLPPTASHLPILYGCAGVYLANWAHLFGDL